MSSAPGNNIGARISPLFNTVNGGTTPAFYINRKRGKRKMKNQKKSAIIRLIVMAVLMVNMVLTLAGKNPIPFDEAELTEWLTVAAAGLSTLWSWWKNNNVTTAAQEAQNTLKAIKEDGDGSDGAVFGETEEGDVE